MEGGEAPGVSVKEATRGREQEGDQIVTKFGEYKKRNLANA